MTETPHDAPDNEPDAQPETEPKPGVNDPHPDGAGQDEPLTNL